jgi:hypothetical protein
MDFTGWPVWAVLALLLLTNQYTTRFFGKALSVLGIVSAKRDQGEAEARKWMERQAEWAADKAFDILEGTIKDFQEQSKKRDETLMKMVEVVQKNTTAIGEQSSAVRLLAQKIIRVEEQLDGISTQWLGRSSAND